MRNKSSKLRGLFLASFVTVISITSISLSYSLSIKDVTSTELGIIRQFINGFYPNKDTNKKDTNKTEDASEDDVIVSTVESKFAQIQSFVKEDQKNNSINKIVNKNNSLPYDYKPSNLVKPNISMIRYETVTKTTSVALEKMFNEAKKDGINFVLRSGYRSYSLQKDIYNNSVTHKGQAHADAFIAKPGQSEHQTGFAVDLTSKAVNYELVRSFAETSEGKWLEQNAHKYGFILRYTKDREEDTGYSFEPWHFRYVGEEVATYIYENNMIFEDLF